MFKDEWLTVVNSLVLKSTIASIIVFCTFVVCGQAQFIDNYSLTVAVNQSLIYSTDRTTVREPLMGWEAGITGEKKLINNLNISAGAKLSRIRFGMEDVGASHVTYFSIPVDIKAIFPLNIFAKIGPRLNFKVANRDARKEIILNGSQGLYGDGFASASDSIVPGWTIGIGKGFNFDGYKPWIEVKYGEDFTGFSGYDGLITMNKRTRKVSIGIPIPN